MKRSFLFGFIMLGIAGAILTGGLIEGGRSARAATTELRESITLSPVSREYALDAGGQSKGELTVVNDGQTAYDFAVYARPYSVTDARYDPNFTDTPKQSDAYQWVRFEKDSWHIEAGETVKIPYTITVPADAAPGGHYGVLFAETQPEDTGSTAVTRKKRVGSIIYATVKGEYRTSGEVIAHSLPSYLSTPPLTATLSVKNTGNTHFLTQNKIRVKDLFGNVKYQGDKAYYILPQTTRDIALSWEKAQWFGLYNVELTTSFLGKTDRSSSLVLIAPLWALFALGAVVAAAGWYAVKRRS